MISVLNQAFTDIELSIFVTAFMLCYTQEDTNADGEFLSLFYVNPLYYNLGKFTQLIVLTILINLEQIIFQNEIPNSP